MRGSTKHFPKLSLTIKSLLRTTSNRNTNSSPSIASPSSARDSSMTRPESGTCLQSTNNNAPASDNQGVDVGLEQDSRTLPTRVLCSRTQGDDHDEDSYQDARPETNKDASTAIMSQSAFIAHRYRLGGTEQAMKDTATSEQASEGVIDCASCATPSQGMCTPAAEDRATVAPGIMAIKRSKSSHQLQSMLCNARPVIINAISDENKDHEVLASYRRNPRNIVIDSVAPELAPHIVITPATDPWNLAHIVEGNCAGFQTRPQLTVPMFYGLTCRMHTYDELIMLYVPPAPQVVHSRLDQQNDQVEQSLYGHTSKTPGARLVFNLDWFQFLAEERLAPSSFKRKLVQVLHRHLYLVTAMTASSVAKEFRRRYNTPEFLESVERPYQWTDPAEPIFSAMGNRCPHELTIISSDCPFAAPHIIIHAAPTDDLYAIWWNTTNEQDSRLGTQLVIYSNKRMVWDDSDATEVPENDDSTDGCSEADSDGPETPTELQRVGSGFFSGLMEDDRRYQAGFEECATTSEVTLYSSLLDESGTLDSSTWQDYQSSPKFYISSDEDWDDDDDGLPDLETDDWFIKHRQEMAEKERIRAAATLTIS